MGSALSADGKKIRNANIRISRLKKGGKTPLQGGSWIAPLLRRP